MKWEWCPSYIPLSTHNEPEEGFGTIRFLRWIPPIVLGGAAGWFFFPGIATLSVLGIFFSFFYLGWTLLYLISWVICVRLVGFRPLLVRAGPLAVIATTNGWRLQMTRPRSITYVEYNPDMSTPLSVERLRARCCVHLLVSPAVNAVLAVLILFASVLSGSTLLWFVGLIAALTFLNGLIPWPRGAGFDGSMGWWLWRWFVRLNDSAQETALSMLWLLLALNYGARPGQVHDRWTELAAGKTAEPRSSVDAHGSLFAYFCALDRSDVVLAEACIRRAITWTSSTEPRLRQLIVIEAAFLAARYLHDVVTAERFLAEEVASVDASLADNLWRAKGAIHLGRGQFEEALAYSAAALEPVPISVSPDLMLLRRAQGTGKPTGGYAAFHQDQVRWIQETAQAALASAR